jgi:hypothetical protein
MPYDYDLQNASDLQDMLAFLALEREYKYRAEVCLGNARDKNLPPAVRDMNWRMYGYWQNMRSILNRAQLPETLYLFYDNGGR